MPLPITHTFLVPPKHIIPSHFCHVLGMVRRHLSDEGVALPWAMLIFLDTGSVWFWLSMAVLQETFAESIALAIFLSNLDFLEFEKF